MNIVLIADATDGQIDDMLDYCREHSLALIRFKTEDVADVSGYYDTITLFEFEKNEDVLFFKLRFK